MGVARRFVIEAPATPTFEDLMRDVPTRPKGPRGTVKVTIGDLKRRAGLAGKGPNGRARCTWCLEEVPKGRQSWCSGACVEAYQLQSDWGIIRKAVYQRDRGICANCATDTVATSQRGVQEWFREQGHLAYRASLPPLPPRPKPPADLKRGHDWATWHNGDPEHRAYLRLEKARTLAVRAECLRRYGIPQHRLGQDGWDADHIVPVIEGGSNDLTNLRTLCIPCHAAETAALARRRADQRRARIPLALPASSPTADPAPHATEQ